MNEISRQADKSRREAEQVLSDADLLYTPNEVDLAIDRMAQEISVVLADKNPIVICLMLGAIIPTGKLLTHLQFPLQLEYVHATRYRGETTGGKLKWIKKPRTNLKDRMVLVIDDILDEGITLSSIINECRDAGAEKIYTAVLVNKITNRQKHIEKADFTGLTVPDRYVFGCGMDYKEYLRNCPGIYAVKDK